MQPCSPLQERGVTRVHVGGGGSSSNDEGAVCSTSAVPPEEGTQFGVWRSLALSAMYIGTSTILFLAIRYSKYLEKQSILSYDSTSIVMAMEVTKILVSVVLKYASDGELLLYSITLAPHRWELWRMSVLYVVPALLYAMYNNLTYISLRHFDPGTVQLFMQTRILFTGFLSVGVLHRSLSLRQWLALIVLTLGLVIKYILPTAVQMMDARVLVVLLQAFLSSLAGVYNELALKREAHLSIHQQNFFLYLYGIFFNLLFGLILAPQEYLHGNFFGNAHIIFIPIIFVGALNGLTAAFILKFINVIVKAFASAVEVVFMALLAAAVLGEPLTPQDLTAGVFVMCSVYLYYTNGCGSRRAEKHK
ncbi:putative nucleotide sugar transporter [Trypanosoma grayi]|uniref:putative nucleotide sugar transporter n=1 Tax=Trypanosoma grayi TaxID=71804 RepID=UPI0004F40719|nr:putative nucleotide sugar transporter [Trypanosoma grayi]KEG12643.1 putative nucleotide sugar transporter [Trypanosoma grayi]